MEVDIEEDMEVDIEEDMEVDVEEEVVVVVMVEQSPAEFVDKRMRLSLSGICFGIKQTFIWNIGLCISLKHIISIHSTLYICLYQTNNSIKYTTTILFCDLKYTHFAG